MCKHVDDSLALDAYISEFITKPYGISAPKAYMVFSSEPSDIWVMLGFGTRASKGSYQI